MIVATDEDAVTLLYRLQKTLRLIEDMLQSDHIWSADAPAENTASGAFVASPRLKFASHFEQRA